MASYQNALICAGLLLSFWTCVGRSLSVRLMPRPLAWPVAPALGWAVHSAVAFPVFCILGMTKITVIGVTGLALVAALLSVSGAGAGAKETDNCRIPLWTIAGAANSSVCDHDAVAPADHRGRGYVLGRHLRSF